MEVDDVFPALRGIRKSILVQYRARINLALTNEEEMKRLIEEMWDKEMEARNND